MAREEIISLLKDALDELDYTSSLRYVLINTIEYIMGSEAPKGLEEAAEEYTQKMLESWRFDSTGCRPPRESFVAGAEWQKQQFEKNYKEIFNDYWTRGFEEGRADMKEQMLKDAVEADVNTYKDPVLSCGWAEFVVDMPSSETDKFGNKVRIIVLKEEE